MPKPTLAAVAACALLLSGCGKPAPQAPIKRQPGSWTQKVDLLKLEGKGADPKAKATMQQMFNSLSRISLCVTPDAAAREDITADFANAGGGMNCTFDKHSVSGEAIEASGTCSGGPEPARISVKGTSGATAQDIMIAIEALDPKAPGAGGMVMHVTTRRMGACTAHDLKPPAPAPAAK